MTTKKCVICGNDFEARYNSKTCSDACSAIRNHQYQRDYYYKHSTKWAWYREMAAVEQLGTSNITGCARKNSDSSINVKAEKDVLSKELKRLGLK